MKARIVKIGNSRGIRIPKPLIAEAGLEDEVEMSVEDDRLVISAAPKPRSSWAEAFRKMAQRGDDVLIDGDIQWGTGWDQEDWEWK